MSSKNILKKKSITKKQNVENTVHNEHVDKMSYGGDVFKL